MISSYWCYSRIRKGNRTLEKKTKDKETIFHALQHAETPSTAAEIIHNIKLSRKDYYESIIVGEVTTANHTYAIVIETSKMCQRVIYIMDHISCEIGGKRAVRRAARVLSTNNAQNIVRDVIRTLMTRLNINTLTPKRERRKIAVP